MKEYNNWLLYVLYDKNKLEEGVRYVGITSTSIRKRLNIHIADARRFPDKHIPRLDWLRSLTKDNIGYQIIKKDISKQEAGELEKTVIKVHRELGYTLLNSTDGGFGNGGNMKGKKHTNETKRKLSKCKKGENHPFFGKKFSEEHRKKLSQSLKGKKHSEETLQKMSESKHGKRNPNFGKKHSEETLQKISEAIRLHWISRKAQQLTNSDQSLINQR